MWGEMHGASRYMNMRVEEQIVKDAERRLALSAQAGKQRTVSSVFNSASQAIARRADAAYQRVRFWGTEPLQPGEECC